MSDIDDDKSLTIDGFCDGESISRAFYFDLKRQGLGPDTYCVGRVVRITPRARREWREKMEELSKQEAAQREQLLRRDQAVRAGKAAVQSERHVSKRRARA